MWISLVALTMNLANACQSKCALLQRGPGAAREIRDAAGLTGLSTLLIRTLGEVSGETVDELKARCDERGQVYTWYRPAGELVTAVLYDDLKVVKSGDTRAVVRWHEQTDCGD